MDIDAAGASTPSLTNDPLKDALLISGRLYWCGRGGALNLASQYDYYGLLRV